MFFIYFNGDNMNIIWKKILKSFLIIITLMVIFSLIGCIFYYFDIFSNTTMKYFEMVMVMLSSFIGGFILGKNVPNKGYLYGIKLSIIMVLIFIILGIIFNSINLLNILYYLIISICIIFGSMLGIMRKSSWFHKYFIFWYYNDTGHGIKQEDINNIWDKYYKVNKNHKRNTIGTGLGLSIVKNILELHSYKYGVISKKNKGTTFYFEIKK